MSEVEKRPPEQPSAAQPATATCATHGLTYNPALFTGCVVCRREQTPRREIAGLQVRELALLGLGTLLLVASTVFAVARLVPRSDIVTGAALEAGSDSRYARCAVGCAEAHSKCTDRCNARGNSLECSDMCFSEAQPCFEGCSARAGRPMVPWSYYYGTAAMPEWSEVLASVPNLRQQLLTCSALPIRTLAYVRVQANGDVESAAVFRHGLSETDHACAVAKFQALAFAPSKEGRYSFLTSVDSRFDDTLLLQARLGQEVEALPRRSSQDIAESSAARLFEAKLAAEKVRTERAALSTVELQRLRDEVERRNNRGPSYSPSYSASWDSYPSSTTKPKSHEQWMKERQATETQRLKVDQQRAERANAEMQERRNQAELERWRRVNEDTRQRERNLTRWRQFESDMEDHIKSR